MRADDERYARAVLHHTEGVMTLFVGERLINKVFAKVMQSHAMGRLVVAHFDWAASAGPRPTLSWLQERTGCGRTLATFIGVAKVAKLVYVETNASDRRERFLTPGPRILNGLRIWLEYHVSLAEHMGVLPRGQSERLRLDPAYFACFVRASPLILDGLECAKSTVPLWQWFEGYECGGRIAYLLLRAHCQRALEEDCPADIPMLLDISGAQVAGMLGLSKSHVRNVLNGAEKLGILSHGEGRRRIRLSAVFLDEARTHVLNLAQLVARTHECTLALLKSTAASVEAVRPYQELCAAAPRRN